MLLEIQDLAIIALVATVVVFYFIIRAIRKNQPATSSQPHDVQPKIQRSSRVIKVLEEEGFSYCNHLPELTLKMTVDDKEQTIKTAQNAAILERDRKRYILKNKTGAMSGKKYNSPIIRNALLELYSSYPVDGIILFDSDRDRYQIISFALPNKSTPNWLVYVLALLSLGLLILLVLQRLGG